MRITTERCGDGSLVIEFRPSWASLIVSVDVAHATSGWHLVVLGGAKGGGLPRLLHRLLATILVGGVCQDCQDATGGVCAKHQEIECTCYEGPGHQMGCAFYGRTS